MMFASMHLQKLLTETADDGDILIGRLWTELHNFVGPGWEQEEDITIIGIKRY